MKTAFWQRASLSVGLGTALGAVLWIGASSTLAWCVLAAVGVAAVVVLAIAHGWRGRALSWPVIALPMLGFAAEVWWQAQSGSSAYPGATRTMLLQLVGCGALFYLTWFGCRGAGNVRRVAGVVWVFSGLLAIEAIAQYFTAGGWIYWVRDSTYADAVGPFVYRNHFAGCMELLLPLAICYAGERMTAAHMSWWDRLGWGSLPLLGICAVILTHSRGALLILVLEAGLAFVLLHYWSHASDRGAMLAVGLAVALGLGFALYGQRLLRRIHHLQEHDVSVSSRLSVDAATWRMFRSAPWLGTGFGSFATVYPRFATVDYGLEWDNAHDDWLQGLAETGVIGAGLVLLVLGGLALRLTQLWRGERTRSAALRWAGCIGLAGLLAHAAIDFQLHSPANAFLFFALLGLVMSPPAAGSENGGPRRRRHALHRPAAQVTLRRIQA